MMEDIHGLKEAIDVPFFSLWEWAVLLFLATFLVFRVGHLLYQAWSIRRKKETSHEMLLEQTDFWTKELQILEDLIASQAFKEFSHRATELLKTHLSHKHQKNITDWTTTEVLLYTKSIHTEYHTQIKTLFMIVDPVKYARQNVSPEKAHKALSVLKEHIKGGKTVISEQ